LLSIPDASTARQALQVASGRLKQEKLKQPLRKRKANIVLVETIRLFQTWHPNLGFIGVESTAHLQVTNDLKSTLTPNVRSSKKKYETIGPIGQGFK
jgi:hypothetical protein